MVALVIAPLIAIDGSTHANNDIDLEQENQVKHEIVLEGGHPSAGILNKK